MIRHHPAPELAPVAAGQSLSGCLTPPEQLVTLLEAGGRYRSFKYWNKVKVGSSESRLTGLIHPYEVRHLTISEIKLMSSFPAGFVLKGSFHEKWARIGNSVPPLLMKAIADHVRLFRKTQRL